MVDRQSWRGYAPFSQLDDLRVREQAESAKFVLGENISPNGVLRRPGHC
jgi:hypothetical protein